MKVISNNSHNVVLEGAKTLYDAVSSTLGPKGRNVLIKTPQGLTVTHDGVRVANAINPDNDSQYGVELIKQASNKMNDVTGDGTTTVTVLSYHLMRLLTKEIEKGKNPMILKRNLESLSDKILSEIDKHTITVDKKKLEQVATISAANEEIGKMVADVVWDIGADGKVITEMTPSLETTVERVTGAKVNHGYASHYFITDEDKLEAKLDNTPVLVYDAKISSIHDIIPLMELMAQSGLNKLAIFCEEASQETLVNLIQNKIKGTFSSVVIQVPSYSTVTLEDIAARTGAKFVSSNSGDVLQAVKIEDLGKAGSIVSSLSDTVIINGAGNIEAYISKLDKDDKRTKERIALLEGRVAIIKVGGLNESEVDERNYRIEDSIAAAQAALRGGIVSGGGSTLYTIAQSIDDPILKEALKQPYLKLMENAGLEAKEIKQDECVDVISGKVVNALKNGIVDPAEVTRGAVENAIATAAISITTATIIDEERKDD